MSIELGRRLIAAGAVHPSEIEAALYRHLVARVPFVRALLELGHLSEEALEEELARSNVPALSSVIPLPALVDGLPQQMCRRLMAVPVRRDPRTGLIDVAAVDPFDAHVLHEFSFHLKGEVRILRGTLIAIEHALARMDRGEYSASVILRKSARPPGYAAPSVSPAAVLQSDRPIPLVKRTGRGKSIDVGPVQNVGAGESWRNKVPAAPQMPNFGDGRPVQRERQQTSPGPPGMPARSTSGAPVAAPATTLRSPPQPPQAMPTVPAKPQVLGSPSSARGRPPVPADMPIPSRKRPEIASGPPISARRPEVPAATPTLGPKRREAPNQPPATTLAPLGPSTSSRRPEKAADIHARTVATAAPPAPTVDPTPTIPAKPREPTGVASGASLGTLAGALPAETGKPRRASGRAPAISNVPAPSKALAAAKVLSEAPAETTASSSGSAHSAPAPVAPGRSKALPSSAGSTASRGATRPSSRPPATTRGPYSPKIPAKQFPDISGVLTQMESAPSRDEIIDCLIVGMTTVARRVGVFAVKKNCYRGVDCNLELGDPGQFRNLEISSETTTLLGIAATSDSYQGPFPVTPQHQDLLAFMKRASSEVAAILVRVAGRPAVILFADELADSMMAGRRGEELAEKASEAFSRILKEGKAGRAR